ncbi:PilZ domain-containing protein [Qipengyuania sp. 1XM1-15A]|uniref:PilZ domain-containing protein n=1 Tax=Qipengyuania xiamenensis TaxID=2867237 RepID=UPI001C88C212|nr:PilZ domain-containing protein [Qipengyuania xiamenensis]MBX7532454.1 PilZ domain-containing protein [Qipengyuania xiamenensis]
MHNLNPHIDERRTNFRHLRVFKPAFIESDGKRYVAMLRDLSPGGAGFELEDASLVEGQPVTYRWGDSDAIVGRVVWADAGRVGITNETIDKDFQLRLEKYRSVRMEMSAPAHIYSDGAKIAGETLNFGQRGLCALVSGQIRQGALATIEIGRRCFQNATAKWVDGERVGFALSETMNVSEMNLLQKGL